ncbi:MAG: glyoxalase superfamily protein [Aliishimia sp.]
MPIDGEKTMELDLSKSAVTALKTEAKSLREDRTWEGTPTSHAQALELVARKHGVRDWNTLRAQAVRPVRLAPGTRVSGTYLGQSFAGHVQGVQLLAQGNRLRVILHFDDAVDVVQFESFSAFRQRVTAIVGQDGRSFTHTSDGVPHMVLETAGI